MPKYQYFAWKYDLIDSNQNDIMQVELWKSKRGRALNLTN